MPRESEQNQRPLFAGRGEKTNGNRQKGCDQGRRPKRMPRNRIREKFVSGMGGHEIAGGGEEEGSYAGL